MTVYLEKAKDFKLARKNGDDIEAEEMTMFLHQNSAGKNYASDGFPEESASQSSGMPKIRISGFPDMRILSGLLDVQHPDIRISEDSDNPTSGYHRISGEHDVEFPGIRCQALEVLGCIQETG